MVNETNRIKARAKRHARVRARISGTSGRPRLCIFRSERHIYVQAIDDGSGATLASASTLELRKAGAPTGNITAATKIGDADCGEAQGEGARHGRVRPWRIPLSRTRHGRRAGGARGGTEVLGGASRHRNRGIRWPRLGRTSWI